MVLVHMHMTAHITFSHHIRDNQDAIEFSLEVAADPEAFATTLTADQIALQEAYAKQWTSELVLFERSGMWFVFIFYLQWMYVFQQFYQATYAGRNKRIMAYFQFENVLDTVILFVGMSYLIIILRDYRYDTFLKDQSLEEEAQIYFRQYVGSPVNEALLLFIAGTLLWIKAFHQLKYLELTGSLYQILALLFRELITFSFFYFTVLFVYSIIGVIVFNDIPQFERLSIAMFTLFRATIQDYDVDIMQGSRVGSFLAYSYFITYLVLNVTLLVNLIVAQLSHAYKKYNKQRNVHMLLSTLQVREVSEADEKYSAVISAPFPLCTLNLIFGSVVLAAKSPKMNLILLHFYFLPVMLINLVLFICYQFAVLPLCYLKMVGHKWALMLKAPKTSGSQSALDRAMNALIFTCFGLHLLIGSALVDIVWFVIHVYKTDLDKSHTAKQKSET